MRIWPRNAFSIVATIVVSSASAADPLLLLNGAGVAQVAGVPSAGPVHYLSGDIPQTANVIAVQLDGTLLIATIDPNAGGGFFGDTRLLRLDQNGVITQQAAFPNRNCVSMTTPSLLRGIDISKSAGEPTVSDFTKIRNQGYQFVIAAGWGGITANGHAETQLSRARSAGLFTAGYCYINFASAYDGARQIRNAL